MAALVNGALIQIVKAARVLYGMANLALIAVKRRGPADPPTRRVPIAVPIVEAAVSLGLLAIRATQATFSG